MATRFQGSEEALRALNAYIALMRAANASTARVHRHLSAVGLTLGQFGVLEALVHVGPMRQNELARRILCSAGNLTIVLHNLEARRLVSRRRDESDERCVVVSSTQKGTRLIEQVFPDHVRRLVEELSVLAPQEQDELRRLCRKLGLRGQSSGRSDDG